MVQSLARSGVACLVALASCSAKGGPLQEVTLDAGDGSDTGAAPRGGGGGRDGGSGAGGSSGGTSGGDSGTDPVPSDFAGTWSGTWNNTTFATSGAASLDVSVNVAEVTVVIDLDGNVFGGSDPPPLTLVGTVDATGFTASTTDDPLFGDVSLTFAKDGTITGAAEPSGIIDVAFDGNGTSTRIDLDYELSSGGSPIADGTLVLTRDAADSGDTGS